LPTDEKVLGWAAVICILLPIASMALDKNKASIELFFHYVFLTILLLCAVGLGWFFLWSVHKRSEAEGPQFDHYGRPLRISRAYYDEMIALPRHERVKRHKLKALLWGVSAGVGALALTVLIAWGDPNSFNLLFSLMGGSFAGFFGFYTHGQANLFPAEELELVDNPPVKVVFDTPPPPPPMDVKVVVDIPEPPPEPPSPPIEPEPFDFRERLYHALKEAIVAGDYAIPPATVFEIVFSVGEQIFQSPREPPELLQRPRPLWPEERRQAWDSAREEWLKSDERVFWAVVMSLSAYLSKLPRFTPAPFQRPFQPPSGSFLFDMIQPLRELKVFGLAPPLVRQFDINTREYTDGIKGATEPLYPHRFKGPPEEMAETYLRHTPLKTLFDVLVPYQPFTVDMRVGHHWCLGRTRQGKTTFLRHLLKNDLEEVANGKCSLVVIDSKTLIGHMRTLKQFAPGGPLDGKLILIDSEHPFPLNPFRIRDKDEAKALLMYMLASVMETTGRQPGALAQFLNGVLHSRDRSLHTLLEYVRMDDNTLPKEIENFPDKTQTWFRTTRKKLHVATESGIEQRLDEFLDKYGDSPAMKHLSADRWGLNLYEELHKGGKVLLVDTDMQKNGTDGVSLLGRLIIALVSKLANDRMKNPGPPVWVYVDEAADYLIRDATFKEIYTKAAEAKVGLTVAYQYLGQIENPVVEKALQNASIHSECICKGTVKLEINRVPSTLVVQKLEFKEEERMEPEEIAALNERLASDYPYARAPAPPKKAAKADFNPDADAV
jgi:hypothetical protein